jgi:hypothetical protein
MDRLRFSRFLDLFQSLFVSVALCHDRRNDARKRAVMQEVTSIQVTRIQRACHRRYRDILDCS